MALLSVRREHYAKPQHNHRRRAGEMLGAVTRNQAAGFYRNADLFILPTLLDGFGITQVEAQTCLMARL
jgi:glycosyltransferase involved in cell wall biosynthesis